MPLEINVKISVISKDEKQLFELVRLLRDHNPLDLVTPVFGTLEKISSMAELSMPDALVLDQPLVENSDLELLERLGQNYPRMAFVLICQQNSPSFLIQAMGAGVRAVLPSPATRETLLPTIARIEEKRGERYQAPGKMLAFVSCKGGSGATFLAANLGHALATNENRRVALIDLNLQFGDASLLISDQVPQATLYDICQQIHRLDPSLLTSSMVNVGPNYAVLAAPEDPTRASDIRAEHVDAILQLARRQYDFVLLDVGHSIDAVSIRALDQADMIFPVLQATLPYIRDGKRLLDVFRSLDYQSEKILPIINRYEKEAEIQLQDMATALGCAVFRTMPNDYQAASASVNHGVPVLKAASGSPISKALLDLAATLTGQAAAAPSGWLSRLFKRA
jgi:pilus assembly protein CpaE